MAKSTGPILAVGAITVANRTIFQEEEIDWRVPIATGLTAMAFAFAEKGWEKGVTSLAWLTLITSLFVRIGGRPAPVESAVAWWGQGPRAAGGGGNSRGPRYRQA